MHIEWNIMGIKSFEYSTTLLWIRTIDTCPTKRQWRTTFSFRFPIALTVPYKFFHVRKKTSFCHFSFCSMFWCSFYTVNTHCTFHTLYVYSQQSVVSKNYELSPSCRLHCLYFTFLPFCGFIHISIHRIWRLHAFIWYINYYVK